MTGLCPDVDKDRNILRSEVCVDRKFLNLLRILCSDIDIVEVEVRGKLGSKTLYWP